MFPHIVNPRFQFFGGLRLRIGITGNFQVFQSLGQITFQDIPITDIFGDLQADGRKRILFSNICNASSRPARVSSAESLPEYFWQNCSHISRCFSMAAAFSDFFPKPYLSSGSRAEISAINSFWKGCKSSGSTFKALTSCSSFPFLSMAGPPLRPLSTSSSFLRRPPVFQIFLRGSGGTHYFSVGSAISFHQQNGWERGNAITPHQLFMEFQLFRRHFPGSLGEIQFQQHELMIRRIFGERIRVKIFCAGECIRDTSRNR